MSQRKNFHTTKASEISLQQVIDNQLVQIFQISPLKYILKVSSYYLCSCGSNNVNTACRFLFSFLFIPNLLDSMFFAEFSDLAHSISTK